MLYSLRKGVVVTDALKRVCGWCKQIGYVMNSPWRYKNEKSSFCRYAALKC